MSASSGVPASAMACSSATTWGTSSTGGVKGVTASATERYASTSRSSDQAALAGLGEGSTSAGKPLAASHSFP